VSCALIAAVALGFGLPSNLFGSAPADRPVFVGATGGARTADFHLRVGNATRRLLTDEVLEYRERRWG